jgi:Domain of unknown function (DUF1841)
MLFNPEVNDVRRFFIDAWKKSGQFLVSNQEPTPLELKAIAIIQKHPEYWDWLTAEDALTRPAPEGTMPPFLHLSLHLALDEQLSIDHPPGVVACKMALCKTYDEHHAEHIMIECLANMIQEAQQAGAWPDTEVYLEKLRKLV